MLFVGVTDDHLEHRAGVGDGLSPLWNLAPECALGTTRQDDGWPRVQ